MYKKFEQFKLWPEIEVAYYKIKGNLSSHFLLQDVELENYTRYNYQPAYKVIFWEFYGHLEAPINQQPAYSIKRKQVLPFTRQKILNVITIDDMPKKEPSFSEMVSNMPKGLPAFRELFLSFSDQAFIVEEAFGASVFLFSKYNIEPSSTTIELYSRDVMLMSLILRWCPFEVTLIMYTSKLQCKGHAKECIQHLMMAKPMLIMLSLII